MDAKETIKYLYENGHIMSQEHYKAIYDELTENEKLKTTIHNALVSLAIINMPVLGNPANVATNDDLLKIMADSFREALKGKQ